MRNTILFLITITAILVSIRFLILYIGLGYQDHHLSEPENKMIKFLSSECKCNVDISRNTEGAVIFKFYPNTDLGQSGYDRYNMLTKDSLTAFKNAKLVAEIFLKSRPLETYGYYKEIIINYNHGEKYGPGLNNYGEEISNDFVFIIVDNRPYLIK